MLRVRPEEGQDWKAYARSIVVFSLVSWLALYLILRTQSIQPLNPEGFGSGPWNLSFNTASSFVTNTNWQYYGGETTLSYFVQMVGLTVQNFVSAAVGIAVLAAVIRGFAARSGSALGNFWADLVRINLYVLLPIAFVAALVLVSQGVIQTLDGSTTFNTIAGGTQTLALGPVASQEAIKELGTNGGGFFNVNSAYPFENASGFTNMVELLLILIVPASLTYTFGRMVGNRRQGWALYAAMMAMFIVAVAVVYVAEQHGSPAQHHAGVLTSAFDGSTGGNMEGKEQRFGIAESSLWTAVTTVTSCGAVNASLDSLTGIGGLVPLANMGTGEVVFGGVGSGLYYMLLVRPAHRVHRRADGRPHAGVPRQEDRVAGGEAGPRRRAGDAAAGAVRDGLGGGEPGRHAVDLQPRPAGLLGVALRLHVAGEQQRLRLRRLHRLRPAERAGQRRCRKRSASPPCSAAW